MGPGRPLRPLPIHFGAPIAIGNGGSHQGKFEGFSFVPVVRRLALTTHSYPCAVTSRQFQLGRRRSGWDGRRGSVARGLRGFALALHALPTLRPRPPRLRHMWFRPGSLFVCLGWDRAPYPSPAAACKSSGPGASGKELLGPPRRCCESRQELHTRRSHSRGHRGTRASLLPS